MPACAMWGFPPPRPPAAAASSRTTTSARTPRSRASSVATTSSVALPSAVRPPNAATPEPICSRSASPIAWRALMSSTGSAAATRRSPPTDVAPAMRFFT